MCAHRRPSDGDDALETVVQLHEQIDREVAKLALVHTKRLVCRRGCSDCCVDDITVFEVEAARIGRDHPRLLSHESAHPEGACAFLDSRGACRIYASRPYVCRTQGLPLRWIEESESGPTIELRDICPLNESDHPPLETLAAEDCWSLGPYESRLAQLQVDTAGAPPRRVRLRDLFSAKGGSASGRG